MQEYNVRVSGGSDKSFYIGRFSTGLPDFLRKNIENEWSLHREGFRDAILQALCGYLFVVFYLFFIFFNFSGG